MSPTSLTLRAMLSPTSLTFDGDIIQVEVVSRVGISPVVSPRRQNELTEGVEGDVHVHLGDIIRGGKAKTILASFS